MTINKTIALLLFLLLIVIGFVGCTSVCPDKTTVEIGVT